MKLPKTLNREACKILREELQAALDKTLGSDSAHKMRIHVGNASFNESSVTFKVEVTPGGEEAAIEKERRDFETYAWRYDMKPEHYGAKIKSGGREFTIYGFAPRKSKRPILARDADGRQFVFEHIGVLRMLGLTDAANKRAEILKRFS